MKRRANVDSSRISTPSRTPIKPINTPIGRKNKFALKDRVVVGSRSGQVEFVGKTSFAEGTWLGINLDKVNNCHASFLNAWYVSKEQVCNQIMAVVLFRRLKARMTAVLRAHDILRANLIMGCSWLNPRPNQKEIPQRVHNRLPAHQKYHRIHHPHLH